jgi:hypothetical protein
MEPPRNLQTRIAAKGIILLHYHTKTSDKVKCVIVYEDKRLPIVCNALTFGLSSSTRSVPLQGYNMHELNQA